MKKFMGILAMGFVMTAAAASPSNADEAPFGYIYTADSIPKGHWGYEQWNTLRSGKANGSYQAFDLRNEVEHGFTDNYRAALYFIFSYPHARDVSDTGDPTRFLKNRSGFD